MPTDAGIEPRTVATTVVHWQSDALTTKLDLIREIELCRLSSAKPGKLKLFFIIFFGGLECVGHSFAYVTHL